MPHFGMDIARTPKKKYLYNVQRVDLLTVKDIHFQILQHSQKEFLRPNKNNQKNESV